MADLYCLKCGGWNPAGSAFCRHCAAPLTASAPTPVAQAAPFPPGSTPSVVRAPSGWPLPEVDPETQRGRDRTLTGLLLLAVGSGLAWIPFISGIGSLILLIGLIYMFLGRHGYGPRHRRFVLAGGALFLVTLLAVIALTLGFVSSLINTAVAHPNDLAALRDTLQSQLVVFVIGIGIAGLLSLVGQSLIAYDLGDGTSRTLLVLGVVLGGLTTVVAVYVELAELPNAISQATAGPTFNAGPISDLQNQFALWGLIKVFPYLAFAWAYGRTRELLRSGVPPAALSGAGA